MIEKIQKRPPVVAILGHVDHGKSSLLEAIKDFKITDKESGGITQHVGAYTIEQDNEKITFIDTPGHEAFSAMRSRGAKVADIGILVIAADEGVKKQTIEAINHLRDAKIPFLVALNKMDKNEANPEKVKKQLTAEEVVVESYGGDIPCVEISALKRERIDELLEMVLLLAEIEEITADYGKKAEGVVIETNINAKEGVSAILLVQEGILEKGNIIGTDCCYGTIKEMKNFQGEKIEKALPATPVKISGLKMNPHVGENFQVFETQNEAKKAQIHEKGVVDFQVLKSSKEKTLNLIIKADVLGSLEAIKNMLQTLPQQKVGINVVSAGIGDITESDVDLAKTFKGVILAYRVSVGKTAKDLIDQNGIKFLAHDIIYNLIENVREEMVKLLQPEINEEEKGRIKVLAIFKTDKKRQIIGGKVIEGEVEQGTEVKVIRDNEEIGGGRLINLQKAEKNVKKVPTNEKFGMLFEGSSKIQEDDLLIVYKKQEILPDL